MNMTSHKRTWICIGAAVAAFSAFTVHGVNADEPRTVSASEALAQFVDARTAVTDPAPSAKAFTITAGSGAAAEPDTTAAPITGGATFVPISPFRTFDSRDYIDTLLVPDTSITFSALTDQDDNPIIPTNAVAITFNLTVTNTFGVGGFLSVFPGGTSWPGNSSINWTSRGISLANGGVTALGNLSGPGQITIYCGNVPGTATDYLVDVTGYYI